jgi:neutral ceramidase
MGAGCLTENRRWFVHTLLVATVLLVPLRSARGESGWMAGAAKVDITPQEPIWLAGYGGRSKPSEVVIQHMFLKALALRDEAGKTSVIVTSDLVGLSPSMVETIVRRALQEYGLARDRLILNYSHNHSAPVTGDVLHVYYDLNAQQKAVVHGYTQKLLDQYTEVIGRSIQNLAPATLAFEQGLAGFAVNRRRSRPGLRHLPGPVDQDVPVLSIRGGDGKLRAILFGYACHNTTLGRYQVSGDYAGYAQEALEKVFPEAIALFLMGCGGDQNPLPRYQGDDPELSHYSVELASMYGRILAAAVDLVLHGKMRPVSGRLNTAFDTVDVPFQKVPNRAELESALKQADSPFRRRGLEYLLGVLDRDGKLPARYPYPVQVWQFGRGLRLVGLTGEPVVDYSLRFKGQYGWDDTWVAGYNNELLAYIPSLRVLKEGSYEGTEGMTEYGLPAPFGHAIEELIAEKVDELVRETRAGEQQ